MSKVWEGRPRLGDERTRDAIPLGPGDSPGTLPSLWSTESDAKSAHCGRGLRRHRRCSENCCLTRRRRNCRGRGSAEPPTCCSNPRDRSALACVAAFQAHLQNRSPLAVARRTPLLGVDRFHRDFRHRWIAPLSRCARRSQPDCVFNRITSQLSGSVDEGGDRAQGRSLR